MKSKEGEIRMTSNPIQKVGQIGVPVNNIERAVVFYKDLLELPLLFSTENMAFFECNGLRLFLSLPEKEEFAQSSSVIYFQVEHINEKYANLSDKGVVFIDEPHIVAKMEHTETWMTFFKDYDGNTHALMSEVTV
jgi:methylmalonyl-CoA/ethylmalonyl-CoA epimerase